MLRYVHGLLLVSLSVSCINNIRVVIGPFVSCVGRVDMCTRTVFCSSSWVWTRCGRDARACLAVPRALPAAELRYFTDRWRDFLHMRARLSVVSRPPRGRARHHPTRPDTPALVSRPAPAGLRLGRARGAARRAPRPPTPGARHLGCRVSRRDGLWCRAARGLDRTGTGTGHMGPACGDLHGRRVSAGPCLQGRRWCCALSPGTGGCARVRSTRRAARAARADIRGPCTALCARLVPSETRRPRARPRRRESSAGSSG